MRRAGALWKHLSAGRCRGSGAATLQESLSRPAFSGWCLKVEAFSIHHQDCSQKAGIVLSQQQKQQRQSKGVQFGVDSKGVLADARGFSRVSLNVGKTDCWKSFSGNAPAPWTETHVNLTPFHSVSQPHLQQGSFDSAYASTKSNVVRRPSAFHTWGSWQPAAVPLDAGRASLTFVRNYRQSNAQLSTLKAQLSQLKPEESSVVAGPAKTCAMCEKVRSLRDFKALQASPDRKHFMCRGCTYKVSRARRGLTVDYKEGLGKCSYCGDVKDKALFVYDERCGDNHQHICRACRAMEYETRPEIQPVKRKSGALGEVKEDEILDRASQQYIVVKVSPDGQQRKVWVPPLKVCSGCGETKETGRFYRTSMTYDGIHSRCKVCQHKDYLLSPKQRRKRLETLHERSSSEALETSSFIGELGAFNRVLEAQRLEGVLG